MHDNHSENGKFQVKSKWKYHKINEWIYLFNDYCFHNNSKPGVDWFTQPDVIVTNYFVENSVNAGTKKDLRTTT